MKPVVATIRPAPAPVFDVRSYGAVGDGTTYDTAAIQKAIDACEGTGGSVLLSSGRFLSAQLTLKGGMTFYVAKDAVLLGGTNPSDYPILVPEVSDSSSAFAILRGLLYANQAHRLILDGGGVIDGQGALVKMFGKESERPSLIRIFQSDDVVVRNIRLTNPRMWTQVYDHCRRLTIDNVEVSAPPIVANLDGMDICDCSDVVVRNCKVVSEDDSICLKSHGSAGLKNILIENNSIYCHRANAIKIGTATLGPIENVQILNNTIYHATYGGVCIESVDGSPVTNIVVRGLDMYGTAQPIFIRLGRRMSLMGSKANAGRAIGSIDSVLIENVRVLGTHSKTVPSSTITGIPAKSLGTIRLRNLYIEMPGGQAVIHPAPPEKDTAYPQSNLFGHTPGYGFYVRHADNVIFENVKIGTIKPDARPWLASDHANVSAVRCEDLKSVKPVPLPAKEK